MMRDLLRLPLLLLPS